VAAAGGGERGVAGVERGGVLFARAPRAAADEKLGRERLPPPRARLPAFGFEVRVG
jgi:hypothetical protein